MTRVNLSTRWAVNAQTSVQLDASTEEVWAVMQRFDRFIAADPYHARVTDEQGNRLDTLPPRGTAIRIGHGIGVTWFDRVGTLVRVVPGKTIAFTDLSKRGRNLGFPHLYHYTLKPISEEVCELILAVRGRWSARWMPRPLVRAWLAWVLIQARWSLLLHTTHEINRDRKLRRTSDPAPQRKAVPE